MYSIVNSAARRSRMLLLLSLLSACGGGSGDGANGNTTPPSAASFMPSSISESFGVGDSIDFNVTATINTSLTGSVYAYIVDTNGVLAPNVVITMNPDRTYTAVFHTSPALAVGRYQGNIELRLCRDAACSSQHPGSPSFLPYDLQVLAASNLTPLTRWVNVSDWEMFQGNAAHTGYVPVTLDPRKFSPRWRWVVPGGNDYEIVRPAVTANGSAYIATTGPYNARDVYTPNRIVSLSESDGSTQWQVDLGSTSFSTKLNPPSVSGGRVFVTTSDYLWSLDAVTGTELFKITTSNYSGDQYAPTIENGAIYYGADYSGTVMFAHQASTGAQMWYCLLPYYHDQWTPAVDANYVYTYIDGKFTATSKDNGQAVFTIYGSQRFHDSSIKGSPVVGQNGSVIAVDGYVPATDSNSLDSNGLISFNIVDRAINWSRSGRYLGNPAVANGIIYAANTAPYQLEARRESDGLLLWSWTPTRTDEITFYGDVVATDNTVFVSTNKRVYAISTATHAPTWSYWKIGRLSISANGVLYIAMPNGGRIDAVNLK